MRQLHLPVEEFTTPNPVTASDDAALDELKALMSTHAIRHLPIVKNKVVIGIVSDRDLRLAAGLSQKEKLLVRAGDIMSPNPVTVNAGTPLDEVAMEMVRLKIGSVIVSDERDRLMGIFTLTDALNALIEIAREATSIERGK